MEPESRKVVIVRKPNLEQWSYDKIIAEYVPPGWKEIFAKTTPERLTIAQVLKAKVFSKNEKVYPDKERIYYAFDLLPPEKVKVVIIGQDPYPQEGKAQGLSFAVSRTDRTIPGSLRNIYKEIKRQYPEFTIPTHGDLRSWVEQGVLLLNMALTVEPGTPRKHLGVWKPFAVLTIKELVSRNPNIIFVLWGNEAKALAPLIGNAPVLTSGHPSSLNREGTFEGNGHFQEINRLLEARGEDPIDWNLD